MEKSNQLTKIERFSAVEKAVAQLENAQAAPFSDTMSYLDMEVGEVVDVVFFALLSCLRVIRKPCPLS